MQALRILVLTKRQYTGRDLLSDRYGRLFEIPEQLAALGHEVQGITMSYRRRPEGNFQMGQVLWQSINASPLTPGGWLRHASFLSEAIRSFKPHLVWASSDAWHAIVSWKVCSKLNIPYVIDLYDNYESFGLSKLPGFISLLRCACRNAAALTVISQTLLGYVEQHYRLPDIPILVLGNAIDPDLFTPRPKKEARLSLGLPEHGILFGTAGALHSNRGIDTLFQAAHLLAKKHPDYRLVLAGPRDSTMRKHAAPYIIDLGILPPSQIPLVFSALDVAVICNKDSSFGRYCYSQKFHEIVCCEVPVLVADVGEMAHLLAQYPQHLFPFQSAEILAERIEKQIAHPTLLPKDSNATWAHRAAKLADFFTEVLSPPFSTRRV